MAAYVPLDAFGTCSCGLVVGHSDGTHQIEGGNVNNDWWLFEHTPGSGTTESSADGVDSWNRWEEDLQLCVDMGLDSYRLSIEWSRIEPAPGEFSQVALSHYRRILARARELGLKNTVTYHHFTTPQWAAVQGSWANPKIVDQFANFARVATEHLGDLIDVAATLNEPNIVTMLGYQAGVFPPGRKGDRDLVELVTNNFVAAHKAARAAMKSGPGNFPVGLTLAISEMKYHANGDANSPGEPLIEVPADHPSAWYLRYYRDVYLEAAREDDFIGVQTYSTDHLGPDGPLAIPAEWRKTDMGWNFAPEALGFAVRVAAQIAQVPVIVTENGIAASNDDERIEYYSRSLTALRAAMDDGVDVRGFFAWSLLDNFEWAEGYRPQFGLVAVDRATFARTPKPSSKWYAQIVAASRA